MSKTKKLSVVIFIGIRKPQKVLPGVFPPIESEWSMAYVKSAV